MRAKKAIAILQEIGAKEDEEGQNVHGQNDRAVLTSGLRIVVRLW